MPGARASISGIGVCLRPDNELDTKLQDWLDAWWETDGLRVQGGGGIWSQGSYGGNAPWGRWAPRINWPEPPKPKPNCLYVPTGCSRWALGWFFVDRSEVKAGHNPIVNQPPPEYQRPKTLTVWGTSGSWIRFNEMYILTPVRVGGEGKQFGIDPADDRDLWLLPLVDWRYTYQYSQQTVVGFPSDTSLGHPWWLPGTGASTATWNGVVLNKVRQDASVVSEAVYGEVDTFVAGQMLNLAPLGVTADQLLPSCGYRLVPRNFENVSIVQRPPIGLSAVLKPGEGLAFRHDTQIVAGTDLGQDPSQEPPPAFDATAWRMDLPFRITVRFPEIGATGHYQGDVYDMTFGLGEDLSTPDRNDFYTLAEAGVITDGFGPVTPGLLLYCTAKASNYPDSTTNFNFRKALAERIIQDWYQWRKWYYDYTISTGDLPAEFSGHDDHWLIDSTKGTTRIVSQPPNIGPVTFFNEHPSGPTPLLPEIVHYRQDGNWSSGSVQANPVRPGQAPTGTHTITIKALLGNGYNGTSALAGGDKTHGIAIAEPLQGGYRLIDGLAARLTFARCTLTTDVSGGTATATINEIYGPGNYRSDDTSDTVGASVTIQANGWTASSGAQAIVVWDWGALAWDTVTFLDTYQLVGGTLTGTTLAVTDSYTIDKTLVSTNITVNAGPWTYNNGATGWASNNGTGWDLISVVPATNYAAGP